MKKIIPALMATILMLVGCQSEESLEYDIHDPQSHYDIFDTNYIPEPKRTSITLTEHNGVTFFSSDVLFKDEYGIVHMTSNLHATGSNSFFDLSRTLLDRTQLDRIPVIGEGTNSLGISMNHVNNARLSRRTVAFDNNDHFFIPLLIYENGITTENIVKFNASPDYFMTRPPDEVIIRSMDNPLFINFFVEDEYMIIFEPSFTEGGFIYDIVALNLITNEERVILSTEYNITSSYGNIIANISVCSGIITLYRIRALGEGIGKQFVDEYDLEGTQISSRAIDVSKFLYMEDVGDNDAIVTVHRFNDYVLFLTLHNRLGIFRIDGDMLVEIGIPSSLQEIGSTRIVNNFSIDSQFLYFFDLINETLYVFDPANTRFFPIEILQDLPTDDNFFDFREDFIWDIQRNIAGDIVIQIRVDMDKVYAELEAQKARGVEFPRMDMPEGSSYFFRLSATDILELLN